ncbi:MAG: adenylate kinase [Planctomycetes bacterium]|nr:adenylate kinase [Planctomycetota bacterium]
MIVILLGAPGVGKGTQAAAAAETQGWTHLSTGEVLRNEVAQGTELGLTAQSYMDRGDLVPDEVILGMVSARLAEVSAGETLLLDGFPRTLAQASALEAQTAPGAISAALYFTASDDTLVNRLHGRGRKDDDRSVIEHRLAVYRETTAPLIDFYQSKGLLREINAERSIDAIQADTVEAVTVCLQNMELQG